MLAMGLAMGGGENGGSGDPTAAIGAGCAGKECDADGRFGGVETLFDFEGEQAWLADRRSDRREGVVRLHNGGFAGNALMPGLGAKGTLRARVDFRWKHGIFRKTVPVHTATGSQTLILTVNIP